MTIIAGLFVTAFGRLLGRRWGAVTAAVAICVYTLLVGAEAAVVRAALMSTLSLFARQVGRRQDGLNSLAFTAAVMALFDPNVLWDIGFQLSFAATLGLVMYAEPLMRTFVRFSSRVISLPVAERLAAPVGEYFLFTIAAQLTTLPITAFHFGRLSLAAVLANPVILPAQPMVMILGGLAVIMGLLYLPLGRLAAPVAWPFVGYTIRMVELFDQLPQAVLVLGKFSWLTVVLFYAALLAWELKPRLRLFIARIAPQGINPPAGAPVLALAIAAVATVLVWRAAWSAPDGRLHLTLLDVSAGVQSGEGLLVQTPGGRYLLINGGPSASQLSEGLGRRLSLVHRQLDFLVVGRTQNGSLDALQELIERYPPGQVLWSGSVSASEGARRLFQALSEADIPVITAQAGHSLPLGNGATLRVLASGGRGAILLLEWEGFRALLPLGASFEEMESLRQGKEVGAVTALLLADSGYAPLNPPEWVANLRPQVVLLSVSALDREGLPSPETLAAIEGYMLLRTDRNGWIHLSTDGERMWVEVERK